MVKEITDVAQLDQALDAAWPLWGAWLPDGFRPPQIRVVATPQAPKIMMVQTLGTAGIKYSPAVYWQADVF